MTPSERAVSLLRHLDHETQRADDEYANARKQAAESVVRRKERMWTIQKMSYADAVKELATLDIRAGMPELAKRDDDIDVRWETTLAECRLKLVRATAEYEGARRMAVEADLIRFDEQPRWEAKARTE